MQHYWLHKKSNKKLIVFFCGWGQDQKPFAPLDSDEYDVLMFYNYQNLETPVEIKTIAKEYNSCVLVAWSMGVMVANILCNEFSGIFSKKIAACGSLYPIDNTFGIPTKQYIGTMKLFSEKVRDYFFQNMNLDKDIIEQFQLNKPERTVEDQKSELESLFAIAKKHKTDSNIFDKALVSGRDKIFSVKNLLEFWGDKAIEIDLPHFIFYNYKNWDAICDI